MHHKTAHKIKSGCFPELNIKICNIHLFHLNLQLIYTLSIRHIILTTLFFVISVQFDKQHMQQSGVLTYVH
ncbi:hypothetical protein SAMN05216334_1137 [Nitrosomonas ureae]|uniref:Uncharacterized protein n=1 Tax=Nitrosomonas ureae TaxID=44577 RepID=A0A1H5VKN3_9PROT|nr:hypothetical protein SAMN05216334_1137 [Nitrosomonas ureae]